MRGIKSENLQAIVDFLYCGEANVFQENLDSFLSIAEELKLKGLMGQTEEFEKKAEINSPGQTHRNMNPKPFCKTERTSLHNEQFQTNIEPNFDKQRPNEQMNLERRIAISNVVPEDLQELDEKVKSMMEKGQNISSNGSKTKICKICRK